MWPPPLICFDGRLPPSLLLPLAEVLLDGVLPMRIQGRTAPDSGHSLAHHLVVEAGPLTVAVVVHRPVGGNTKMARCLHCIIDTPTLCSLEQNTVWEKSALMDRSPWVRAACIYFIQCTMTPRRQRAQPGICLS